MQKSGKNPAEKERGGKKNRCPKTKVGLEGEGKKKKGGEKKKKNKKP